MAKTKQTTTSTPTATAPKKARRPSRKASAPESKVEEQVAQPPAVPKADEAIAAPEADAGDTAAPEAGEKVSKMSVEELRARFAEITGRGSTSSNRRYLVWRVQQAVKGRVPVGPRRGRGGERVPMKVLPMRVPAAAVEPLAEARTRLGLRSRNDLFLKAIHAYLAGNGEGEVAALLDADDAE